MKMYDKIRSFFFYCNREISSVAAKALAMLHMKKIFKLKLILMRHSNRTRKHDEIIIS